MDLAQNSNVQDAFVIAVEQQARERLEKLSALKKIKPVDMTKLSQELNECPHTSAADLNGVIESNSIYVTSVPDIQNATLERARKDRLSISSNNGSLRRTPSPSSPNSFTGSAGGPGGESRARNGSVSGGSFNGVEAGHCETLSEEPEVNCNDEDSVYDHEFDEDLDIPDQELTLKQDILDDIISVSFYTKLNSLERFSSKSIMVFSILRKNLRRSNTRQPRYPIPHFREQRLTISQTQ